MNFVVVVLSGSAHAFRSIDGTIHVSGHEKDHALCMPVSVGCFVNNAHDF